MTECRSPELQDLLPEYVADGLDDVTASRVSHHLRECEACLADVALLRQVRAVRPVVRMPDVARIVAALPAPPVRERPSQPASSSEPVVLPVVASDTPVPLTLRNEGAKHVPTAAPRRRLRVAGMPMVRMAAVLGLVVAGASSALIARRGVGAGPGLESSVGTLSRAESLALVASTESASAAQDERALALTTVAALPAVSVSYGDLGDYTTEELEQMLDRIERWDGATSTEPLPGVPLVAPPGGITP
jgi:hypothetical protein